MAKILRSLVEPMDTSKTADGSVQRTYAVPKGMQMLMVTERPNGLVEVWGTVPPDTLEEEVERIDFLPGSARHGRMQASAR